VSGDWRTRLLPDGRVVEYVYSRWVASEESDPLDTRAYEVTAVLDGALVTVRGTFTVEEIEQAMGGTP